MTLLPMHYVCSDLSFVFFFLFVKYLECVVYESFTAALLHAPYVYGRYNLLTTFEILINNRHK